MKVIKYIILWIISFFVFMNIACYLSRLLNNSSDDLQVISVSIYMLSATVIVCTFLIINYINNKNKK
jgi:glucan phosphoethanolaminetransferase (alkaline phosphatase superfamily)